MKLLERVDAWFQSGDINYADLRTFRIIFAIYVVLTLPSASWTSRYPSRAFEPPPGPVSLLPGPPSEAQLLGMEVVVIILCALIISGLAVRVASFGLAAVLITLYGVTYSYGKVDHTILVVIAPIFMALAGWSRGRHDTSANLSIRQWPIRLYAICIGVALATAAVPKALSGWLSIDSQAALGHFWVQVLVNDRTDLLSPLAQEFRASWLWEPLDWATVLLEGAVLFSLLHWKWLRANLALLALFHLSVLLFMNIAFTANVVAYAAFFRWSQLGRIQSGSGMASTTRRWAVSIGFASVAAGWHFGGPEDGAALTEWAVVVAGGLLAIGYLGKQVPWTFGRGRSVA